MLRQPRDLFRLHSQGRSHSQFAFYPDSERRGGEHGKEKALLGDDFEKGVHRSAKGSGYRIDCRISDAGKPSSKALVFIQNDH